jgi:hypothetical protein
VSYTAGDNGRYSIPLVDFGHRLQDNFGLRVREHDAFGGVSTGVHSDNSYHKFGEAVDITDWRDDDIDGVSWKDRTINLRQLLAGAGPEVLGPDNDSNHGTHLHLAATGGNLSLSQQQYDYFYGGNSGGKRSTFSSVDLPISDSTPSPSPTATETKPVDYSTMTKSELDSSYDNFRKAGDVLKASEEGMKMHKAYFGKK